MADCLKMGDTPQYQVLRGLQDIRTLQDLTEEAVRDILRRSTGDHDLSLDEMGQFEDMSGLNDAFNSTICSLQVTATYTDKQTATEDSAAEEEKSKTTKTFHFVIKSPPKASFIRLMHKITKPFLNEVTWYMEMSRQIEYAEKDEKPGTFKVGSLVPVCYHTYSNYFYGESGTNNCAGCPAICLLPFRKCEEGILVLENVNKRGFKMFDKMKILPLEHTLLVMKNLAHFHGKWLRWRFLAEAGKLPGDAWTLKQFKSALNTQKRVPKFIYKQLLNGTEKTVEKILKSEGGEEENIAKCRNFFRRTVRTQLDLFMGEVEGPIDTCCHGDFWSNNILFSYDEEGKVDDLILVDFQLLNFGHPAYDVIYVLYLSLDLEFRNAHQSTLLAQYWDVLKTYIEDSNAPSDLSYTWEDFDKDFQTYRRIGFVLASTCLPNVLSDTQVEPGGLMALRDLQRKISAELEDDTKETSKEIKRRILGLVHELARDGLI